MNVLKIKPFLSTLMLASALISATSLAELAVIEGHVNRVLIENDGNFGGCMAQLSSNPQAVLPSCGADWVTFSCTGDFTDQVSAYRSLDQAQLALAANKLVLVVVDDTRRHNGYCFGLRIDVAR